MDDMVCGFCYDPPKQIREISNKRRKIIESLNGRIGEDDSDVHFDISIGDDSIRFISVDYKDVPDKDIVSFTLNKIYLSGYKSGQRLLHNKVKEFLDEQIRGC